MALDINSFFLYNIKIFNRKLFLKHNLNITDPSYCFLIFSLFENVYYSQTSIFMYVYCDIFISITIVYHNHILTNFEIQMNYVKM